MPPTAPASLVVRRALSAPRDVRAVAELLSASGAPPADDLAAALSSDGRGVVLVAWRRGEAVGLAVLALAPAFVTAGPGSARIERVFVRPDARRAGVGSALVEAARAECEARGVEGVTVVAPPGDAAAEAFLGSLEFSIDNGARVYRHGAPPPDRGDPGGVGRVTAGERFAFELAPGVAVAADPGVAPADADTLWSGALAFRTRWSRDRAGPEWSAPGCVGSGDDDGDALRFDAATGRLRESYLARPRVVAVDAALLGAAARAPLATGALALASPARPFALAPMDVALYDTGLGCYVAVRAALLGASPDLRAVALSPHAAVLVADGRYVGWRVLDPVAHARPMGWPEPRRPAGPSALRDRLAALLYDWMTIDASAFTPPAEAADPEEVEHLVAVRARARALADAPAPQDDPAPGVARDVAAHIHWSWGFYKVGE